MVSTFSGHQYIARPLQGDFLDGLFLFLVLERSPNSDVLAMAHYQLMHTAFGLSLVACDSRGTQPLHPQSLPLDTPFTDLHDYLPESAAAIQ